MPSTAQDWLTRGRHVGAACRLPLPRQALAGAMGDRLGHDVGASLEFQDYREYQPGDDLRRLDWRAYARTDRLTVRLYREEIQPHLDLIGDFSRSMTAPTAAKADAALMLTGIFAEAALQAGLSIAWHGFGDGWQPLFPKTNAFPPCAVPAFTGTRTLADELAGRPPRLLRRGIRVCFSDFLWEGDPIPALRRLATHAAVVLLVNVLAAEELDPPAYGAVNLLDVETGDRLDLSVGPAEQAGYRTRLDAHRQRWREGATRNACRLVAVRAEDILAGQVNALLAAGFLEPR
jgi:uncharacterized protein (DUF58 family)